VSGVYETDILRTISVVVIVVIIIIIIIIIIIRDQSTVEMFMYCICVWEVPGLNLDWSTTIVQSFMEFTKSCKKNVRLIP
jgi:uncharacterized integral membrane protein